MYKMYEMYEMYKMYKMYKEDMRRYKTDGRYPSQYNFHNKARSRQLAGDLSSWHRECREACISSLTIGSLTLLKTEQHFISKNLSFDIFDSQWPRSIEALPVTCKREVAYTRLGYVLLQGCSA